MILTLTFRTINHQSFSTQVKNELSEQSLTWFDRAAEHSTRDTRQSSSPFNLKPRPWNNQVRCNFFTNRVVRPWNNLSVAVQNSSSIESFKIAYDEFLNNPWVVHTNFSHLSSDQIDLIFNLDVILYYNLFVPYHNIPIIIFHY